VVVSGWSARRCWLQRLRQPAAGVLGAVVAQVAFGSVTMGHEIGHVLGLSHVNDNNRLMTGNGTSNITNPPPDLISTEVNTMRASADLRELRASMAITMKDVRAWLDPEEPNYAGAKSLGPAALLFLLSSCTAAIWGSRQRPPTWRA
jgi:hypothetical protein